MRQYVQIMRDLMVFFSPTRDEDCRWRQHKSRQMSGGWLAALAPSGILRTQETPLMIGPIYTRIQTA